MSITDMYELPEIITADYYDNLPNFAREAIWQLCSRDLNENDCRINSMEELSRLCFNTKTRFPDKLQDMADKVLEDGKKHALGDVSLTGKGVKVAVIDRAINKNHTEFKDRIEYINVMPDDPLSEEIDFHGMTCASFLSGSTCGVATESELVYFAIPNRMDDIKRYYGYQLRALEKILEYNKTSSSPIRVVSLSARFSPEQTEERDKLAAELEKTGCTLFDIALFGRYFQGIDFVRYGQKPEYQFDKWQIENYENNKDRPGIADFYSSLCYIPATRRTSASNDSDDAYIHWSKAVSWSWTVPHAAGAYALCLQSDPNMSTADFIEKCKSCPRINGHIVLDIKRLIQNV